MPLEARWAAMGRWKLWVVATTCCVPHALPSKATILTVECPIAWTLAYASLGVLGVFAPLILRLR